MKAFYLVASLLCSLPTFSLAQELIGQASWGSEDNATTVDIYQTDDGAIIEVTNTLTSLRVLSVLHFLLDDMGGSVVYEPRTTTEDDFVTIIPPNGFYVEGPSEILLPENDTYVFVLRRIALY